MKALPPGGRMTVRPSTPGDTIRCAGESFQTNHATLASQMTALPLQPCNAGHSRLAVAPWTTNSPPGFQTKRTPDRETLTRSYLTNRIAMPFRASIHRQTQGRQGLRVAGFAQHSARNWLLPFPFASVSSTGQALSLSKGTFAQSEVFMRLVLATHGCTQRSGHHLAQEREFR